MQIRTRQVRSLREALSDLQTRKGVRLMDTTDKLTLLKPILNTVDSLLYSLAAEQEPDSDMQNLYLDAADSLADLLDET